ncbi:hypothetical protein ASF10_09885 [Flavobacterium sp. Leaf82]|uniref:hypothetical protein n=1 Tax=Flavobacterium sp. Leaf82 TaxID=1736238 RepID=UPI0006F43ADB|nr:hypothetical protein [Flavobacterium sp. Leaf82]KQO22668.1 hypothetical protein ASF10_09885 [Flavobacterium sp. Leaf82]
MQKRFKIRHEILKKLFEKNQLGNSPNASHISDIALTWTQLIKVENLSENEILEQIYYLKNQNEVKEKEDDNFEYYYWISNIGIDSFYNYKYLNEGKKESRENYFNKVRNWSITILLIIAVVTFLTNIFVKIKNNSDLENLQNEVNKLKVEVNKQKNLINKMDIN